MTNPTLRWLFVRLPVDPDAPNSRADPPLRHPIAGLLVAFGGVAGSLARAALGIAFPHHTADWPWSTVIVNVAGSGMLAFLLVVLLERFPASRLARPLLGTGFMGGFTTYSTFAVDVVQLSHAGRQQIGALYILVTLAGTGAAAVAGVLLARAADRLADQQRWARRIAHAELRSGTNDT